MSVWAHPKCPCAQTRAVPALCDAKATPHDPNSPLPSSGTNCRIQLPLRNFHPKTATTQELPKKFWSHSLVTHNKISHLGSEFFMLFFKLFFAHHVKKIGYFSTNRGVVAWKALPCLWGWTEALRRERCKAQDLQMCKYFNFSSVSLISASEIKHRLNEQGFCSFQEVSETFFGTRSVSLLWAHVISMHRKCCSTVRTCQCWEDQISARNETFLKGPSEGESSDQQIPKVPRANQTSTFKTHKEPPCTSSLQNLHLVTLLYSNLKPFFPSLMFCTAIIIHFICSTALFQQCWLLPGVTPWG